MVGVVVEPAAFATKRVLALLRFGGRSILPGCSDTLPIDVWRWSRPIHGAMIVLREQ